MKKPNHKPIESWALHDDLDPLPDWVDLGELDHLLLLRDGASEEEFESHKQMVQQSSYDCELCDAGIPNDAYRAFLLYGDPSPLRKAMAERG